MDFAVLDAYKNIDDSFILVLDEYIKDRDDVYPNEFERSKLNRALNTVEHTTHCLHSIERGNVKYLIYYNKDDGLPGIEGSLESALDRYLDEQC